MQTGCTAIYVDGTCVASVEQTDGFDLSIANCIGSTSTFYVGYAAWGEFYHGSLKNLVVYNTAIYSDPVTHASELAAAADAALEAIEGTKVTVNEVIDDDGRTYENSSNTPELVFDGDTSTFYDGAVEGAWVGAKIDSTVISTVAIYARSANYERIAGAVIQGSNDGENWTDLYTIETAVQNEWIICDITDTTAYTYVRVYNCAYGNVAEMNIYTTSSSGTNTGSNTGSNTGTTSPQTGFAFVGLGVVALASGAAIVVSKKRH
ncbi:MAG: discoidin domain-containing protein [Clostridiales bacterium]|nr:discoidin domain-containing protein [Clostridiales bacterium]